MAIKRIKFNPDFIQIVIFLKRVLNFFLLMAKKIADTFSYHVFESKMQTRVSCLVKHIF